MTKKTKIIIAIFVALFSFSALVVLANEAASTIYMPVAYKNYGNVPTATPTPGFPSPVFTLLPTPKMIT